MFIKERIWFLPWPRILEEDKLKQEGTDQGSVSETGNQSLESGKETVQRWHVVIRCSSTQPWSPTLTVYIPEKGT